MPRFASQQSSTHTLLHRALQLDALASGGMGALLAAAAGPLADLLGLPAPLLRGAGALLLPYAAFVAVVGTRRAVPRGAAWAIVACNVAWVAASVVLVERGPGAPTRLGYAVIVAQALAVLAFAALQAVGLRGTAAHGGGTRAPA